MDKQLKIHKTQSMIRHLKLQPKLLPRIKVEFETDYYNVHAISNKGLSYII